MLTGAICMIYSKNPEAACSWRDVLKLTHVDVGQGWLIFGLPPSGGRRASRGGERASRVVPDVC